MQNKTLNEPWVQFKVRKAKTTDIDAVYHIRREQFTTPWKKEQFRDELYHHIANFFVSEDISTGKIAGYIIFWIIEEILEIHDIAVKEEAKRKSVANSLMDVMLKEAAIANVKEIFLEVRKSNAPAIRLYEKYGFKKIGKREKYFSKPVECANVYKLEI